MPFSRSLEELRHLSNAKLTRDEFCHKAAGIIADSSEQYDWVGIYLTSDEALTLPEDYYRGLEPEHKVIPFDEGICGAAATQRETVVVDDVTSDPRYLACSISTQSEIVVPIITDQTLYGVLDLDSDTPAAFSTQDQEFLEAAAAIIGKFFSNHNTG